MRCGNPTEFIDVFVVLEIDHNRGDLSDVSRLASRSYGPLTHLSDSDQSDGPVLARILEKESAEQGARGDKSSQRSAAESSRANGVLAGVLDVDLREHREHSSWLQGRTELS